MLRREIEEDLSGQTTFPEDQIDHVIDQMLDTLEKAKAEGRELDEVELQLINYCSALRHFFASWCINRRVDGGLELPLKIVQERLGHSSITLTADRYGHLFPRGDDAAELEAAENALLA
jgi:integrase